MNVNFSNGLTNFCVFSGENDFLKPHGTALLESFVDPVVIHHPKGHTIPRLGNFSHHCTPNRHNYLYMNICSIILSIIITALSICHIFRWEGFGDNAELPWKDTKGSYQPGGRTRNMFRGSSLGHGKIFWKTCVLKIDSNVVCYLTCLFIKLC